MPSIRLRFLAPSLPPSPLSCLPSSSEELSWSLLPLPFVAEPLPLMRLLTAEGRRSAAAAGGGGTAADVGWESGEPMMAKIQSTTGSIRHSATGWLATGYWLLAIGYWLLATGLTG